MKKCFERTKMVEVAPASGTKGPTLGCGMGSAEDFRYPYDSIYELWQGSLAKFANNKFIGERTGPNGEGPYEYQTYAQTGAAVTKLQSALAKVGVSSGSKVGILSPNCIQWMELLLANASQSCVTIPLYDTLGADVIEYIIDHAECEVACVNTGKKQLAAFVGSLPQVQTEVKAVVLFGKEDNAAAKATVEEAIKGTNLKGAAVYTYAEFLALGDANPAEPVPPKKEDLAVIMYTSGTTGNPKGVMLLHDTYMYEVGGAQAFLQEFVEFGEDDTFFSFLPLAHIFDQVVEIMYIGMGAHIGYWRGDVKLLVDDIGACKPTLFAGVPRIYDKIYAGVMAKFNSKGILKWLLKWATERKLYFMEKVGLPQSKASPLADKIVFKKVAQKLGGRVKAVCSGAAPLARHVEDFLRVGMCAGVSQGYGLTETCAASCIVPLDYPNGKMAGTVGVVTPAVQVCLDAVPEMNYLPTNDPPAGEICFKGPAVFKGYYKQPELTAEVLEESGWFHTGDIGIITPEGAIKIVDRKKNIFKLSQGEYVAVEKLENIFGKCGDFDAVWVYGNSFESTLVAVVCPNEDKLKKWAGDNGVSGDFAAICASDKAKAHILSLLTTTGKEGRLKGFEMVKAVHLEPEAWTPESELLTPTFKKKRPQLLKKYQAEVDAMYAAMKK